MWPSTSWVTTRWRCWRPPPGSPPGTGCTSRTSGSSSCAPRASCSSWSTMQRKQPDMTCIELIDTPPAELYRLVADVTTWPVIFEQVVQVQRLQRGHGAEWFRLWTVAGGRVRTATLRRWLNPDRLRIAIDADPDDSGLPAPFAGRWSFHPVADGRSEVVLDQPAEARDAPRVLAALNRV